MNRVNPASGTSNFTVGNIGSVGGDVFSGKKVSGDKIAIAEEGSQAIVREPDEPKSIKRLTAIAAFVTAIAVLLGSLLQFQGCREDTSPPPPVPAAQP